MISTFPTAVTPRFGFWGRTKRPDPATPTPANQVDPKVRTTFSAETLQLIQTAFAQHPSLEELSFEKQQNQIRISIVKSERKEGFNPAVPVFAIRLFDNAFKFQSAANILTAFVHQTTGKLVDGDAGLKLFVGGNALSQYNDHYAYWETAQGLHQGDTYIEVLENHVRQALQTPEAQRQPNRLSFVI